jgi:hypothetical protein
VAERFLENESLTADLDDGSAKMLLDWGMSRSKVIAQSTDGLDDEAAEEAMYPRLRAMRRLMRSVNRWVTRQKEMDDEGRATLLDRMIEQAAIIYDKNIDRAQREAFRQQLATLADTPQQMIGKLRAFFDSLDD